MHAGTAHPEVGHLNKLEHGPISLTQSGLTRPDHFGKSPFVGTIENDGKKYFFKVLHDPGDHKREVVVQHVADALGLGHMVPRTSIHATYPHGKQFLPVAAMLQEHVDGHQYGTGDNLHPHRDVGLQVSAHRGDLAKAALMNYFLGNADRHRNNYRAHPEHGVKLYDHGLTFLYNHGTRPEYLIEDAVRDKPIGIKLEDFVHDPGHEEAVQAIESAGLDPDWYHTRRRQVAKELRHWGDDGTLTHGQLYHRLRLMP